MSGERGEANQNAEVVPDAGDAAKHRAQARLTSDHVFAPFVVRFVHARGSKIASKVCKTIKLSLNMTRRDMDSVSKQGLSLIMKKARVYYVIG